MRRRRRRRPTQDPTRTKAGRAHSADEVIPNLESRTRIANARTAGVAGDAAGARGDERQRAIVHRSWPSQFNNHGPQQGFAGHSRSQIYRSGADASRVHRAPAILDHLEWRRQGPLRLTLRPSDTGRAEASRPGMAISRAMRAGAVWMVQRCPARAFSHLSRRHRFGFEGPVSKYPRGCWVSRCRAARTPRPSDRGTAAADR